MEGHDGELGRDQRGERMASRREVLGDALRLGLAASLIPLASCKFVESQREFGRKKENIRRAILGEAPETVVTGVLRGTAAPPAKDLIVVTGTTTTRCQKAPAGCSTYYSLRQLFQAPATIDGPGGPTALWAPLSAVWQAGPGLLALVYVSDVERVASAEQLTRDRVWSFSEGDKVSIYGLIETRDGAPGFHRDVEIIMGDVDVFVRGI